MFVDRHPVLFYAMVTLSVVLALLLSIIPLPHKYLVLRPEFVCLMVIYWVISVPQHLGVSFAFLVGITQDLAEHTVWGAHALAMAIVAYIGINAYQRFIRYSVWHQALWVSILVGLHQVVVNWVQSLTGQQAPASMLLASTVVSTLLWPPLLLGFRRLRRYLHFV